VNFIMLADGRRIAYEEKGVEKRMAKQSLLVLHGVPSSHIVGMLGVSEDLLKEMGVRLLSIDRPGYSLSDFNQKQTYKSVAGDIAEIADALELGEKFWLLGYSGGGPYCWAAARFIPERLAGIATWAPVGNYGWKVGFCLCLSLILSN
jgi:pimeloyl-ACP methyl ester carboxylesterase